MRVRAKTIPDAELTTTQREHLRIAREIVGNVPVHPAVLTNTVHIIGAYKVASQEIFIAPERLKKLRYTTNTTIHELAHHKSQADDGTKAHNGAITKITAQVADNAADGRLDNLLGGVKW